MKAVVRERFGGPENIEVRDIADPAPGPGEVLIRVHASTVSRTDVHNLYAKPYIMRSYLGVFRPKFPILGTDLAGEVVETGVGVTRFRFGDRVMGLRDTGFSSQAELVVVKENNGLITIPEGIDFVTAAASLEGPHYAHSFLAKASPKPGQKAWVNGATGSIGSALVQLLQPLGVEVSATCRAMHFEKVRELGAAHVLDYEQEDFTQSGDRVDFVFDAVGKSTFSRCRRILSPKGIYISSELGPFAQNIPLSLFTPFAGKRKVIFPIPYSTSRTLPFISEQLEKQVLHPLIDRVVTPSEAADAYRYAGSGQKTGSVVIDFHMD